MGIDSDNDRAKKRVNVYAALGVGFVCVVIGLPLWWKTTQVYRVSLPYSDIQILADTKVDYTVELDVVSFVDHLKGDQMSSLSQQLMEQLEGSGSSDVKPHYRTAVREATPDELKVVSASTSIEDLDTKLTAVLRDSPNVYHLILLPGDSALPLSNPTLGLHRCLYFSANNHDIVGLAREIVKTVQSTLVRESHIHKAFKSAKGEITAKPDKEMMRSVRSHPGYDVILTLVSPEPNLIDVDWDIEEAVKVYLDPLIKAMEDYVTISVKSQVLFYTKVQTRPRKGQTGHFFNRQDLPHIINPLETKLGSPASTNPELNFLVYVPSSDQYPIYIQDDEGFRVDNNAFLSPQWGGILIYNVPPPAVNSSLPMSASLDMRTVMGVFLSQLRLLLNLHTHVADNTHLLPVSNTAVATWELDAWLRSRCVENLATSSATLKSLAALLDQISNIVINDDIGKEVELAVESLRQSHQLLAQGNLLGAFKHSRSAIIASEKAFFDPSLLELLYFPEDQKFAIYIPLFLPISFPVVSSLWQAFRWFKDNKKVKQE